MTKVTSPQPADYPAGAGPLPEIPGVDVTHEFYDLPAGRFHVARAGDPSLPAILLVHGFPQSWLGWSKVIPLLAGEAHLVLPDLRGHGWSTVPTEPGSYSKSGLADDLHALLDAIGIESIAVVGHDWGGYTSQLLALDHPERVRRLLALSIPSPIPSGPRPPLKSLWRMNYQLLFSAPFSNRLIAWRHADLGRGLRQDVQRRDVFTREEAEAFMRPYADPARAKAAQMMYRSFVFGDFATITKRLKGKRFQMPVRFILSAYDAYIPPEFVHTFARLGEDVQGEVQDRTGHFLPDEDPEWTAQQIREWVLPGAVPIG